MAMETPLNLAQLCGDFRLLTLEPQTPQARRQELKKFSKRFYAANIRSEVDVDDRREATPLRLEGAAQWTHTDARITYVFLGNDKHSLCQLFISMAIEFFGGPEEFDKQRPRLRTYHFKSLAHGTTDEFYSHCKAIMSIPLVDISALQSIFTVCIGDFFSERRYQFMMAWLEKDNGHHMRVVFANPNFFHPMVRSFKGGYKRHLTSQIQKLAEMENTLVVLDPSTRA